MSDQVTDGGNEDIQEAAQPQVASFTPDDLVAAILSLDEASEQGAFKGWENQQKALHARQRLMMFAQHWQRTLEEASKDALAKAAAAEGGA